MDYKDKQHIMGFYWQAVRTAKETNSVKEVIAVFTQLCFRFGITAEELTSFKDKRFNPLTGEYE